MPTTRIHRIALSAIAAASLLAAAPPLAAQPATAALIDAVEPRVVA